MTTKRNDGQDTATDWSAVAHEVADEIIALGAPVYTSRDDLRTLLAAAYLRGMNDGTETTLGILREQAEAMIARVTGEGGA